MKISRIFLLLSFLLLGGLLSACSGTAGASSWPGMISDNKTAYVSFNQHVYAVDLGNGAEQWRFPAKADAARTFFAPPVLTKDGQLLVSGFDSQVYSLNPQQKGQENQASWPFKAKNRFIAAPLVTDQMIYAPSADGSLYALDLKGKQVWSFKTGQPVWATPATDGKTIFLSSMDRYVYALDPANGKEIWKSDELGGAIVGSPALGEDGTVFIGSFGNEMVAINGQSGKVKNRYTTNGWVWAGPVLAGDKLYFGDLTGNLYALNTADLSQVWKVQPDASETRKIADKPLVTQDTIYFSSESGNLFALSLADGSTRWSKPAGGKLNAAPVAAGDLILVAPDSGPLLVAFDANGNQKWTFTPTK